MQMGLVIGRAISTVKHDSFHGQKLLIVQPQLTDLQTPDGDPLVAIDAIGAGIGERVMLTSDGRGAREFLGVEATPVRWTVIGIQDEWVSHRGTSTPSCAKSSDVSRSYRVATR